MSTPNTPDDPEVDDTQAGTADDVDLDLSDLFGDPTGENGGGGK